MISVRKQVFFKASPSQMPVTVIVGACRSGKTLLGNALATCSGVEYADEPWTAMLLPMAAETGQIDKEFARGWLGAFVSELVNDLILLRAANFRPGDLSSIWTKKPAHEILRRLSTLNTRDEVRRHIQTERTSLLITLSDCASFSQMICDAVGGARFVHVVRNGFDVAADLVAKGWFSDAQLLTPANAQLFSLFQSGGNTYHLPWWVADGDEDCFLSYSEFERGLYYWSALIEAGLKVLESKRFEVCNVSYHDLVAHPARVVSDVASFMGVTAGSLTQAALAGISVRVVERPSRAIDAEIQQRVNTLNKRLGVD